ncbi:MAG: ABC transporter substrate-binding protein [Oscillospiraceae bacterium]|nr:ABC transporter substrate-binding protein [Oscillospiraceae bacterium]MBR2897812.1 ABC transporter substrate-binding protein [Oscillospiraceae bacterium]MBR2977965.1 ABC transporter substrate-binding protein [Oscillospiraceae bacterium]
MKKILALTLALCMVLALAACGAQTPATETNDGTAAAGALKIGGIGPITGAAAIYGTAVMNGAQIAVDEINAKGGLQVELNFQDDEHDAEKSVNAYNTLADWGAQMICGVVTTTPCIAVAAEANKDHVFMLTPSASSPLVISGDGYSYDNIFQLCFSDPNQGSASAQYIKDNALATKVAVIYNNADAYSTGIYQTFKEKAAEVGLEIVSETTFTDDTTDFSVQVADAQAKGAELVFLPIYYTPASLILKQAASVGYAPKFFGVDGMDGILGLEGFDTTLAEGVMLLTPFSADAEDDRTKAFVAKYQELHNEVPSQFAADGYDVVYALYEAALAAGVTAETTPAEACDLLRAQFVGSFTTDGLTGAGMTWSEDGTVTKAPRAVVIRDGAYVGA